MLFSTPVELLTTADLLRDTEQLPDLGGRRTEAEGALEYEALGGL